MQKALIVYAIVQLMTTAYGLAVIESIRPLVEERLRDKGYIKNKNSLYTFSNTFSDIAKGFIPCYYLIKAIKILSDKGSVDKTVNEHIKSGRYISEEDYKASLIKAPEEDTTDSIYKSPYDYAFEKPDKYKARKNTDVADLYKTYETPIEYIERVSERESDLELTPFQTPNRIVDHVVVKSEVTNADIAKAIAGLDSDSLRQLDTRINELAALKREQEEEYTLGLDKEAA